MGTPVLLIIVTSIIRNESADRVRWLIQFVNEVVVRAELKRNETPSKSTGCPQENFGVSLGASVGVAHATKRNAVELMRKARREFIEGLLKER